VAPLVGSKRLIPVFFRS